MHSYLRAIGLSHALSSEYETEILLDNLFHTYDQRIAVKEEKLREDAPERAYVELSKSFGPDMGLRVCGELDGYGFHRLCYYPYLDGHSVSSEEEVTVDSKINGDGYTGLVEDGRMGVSLIFYLQNPGEFRRESFRNHLKGHVTTTLTGLSLEGMILLPSKETDLDVSESQEKYYQEHDSLVTAAKNGNQEAIESLTLEDMDTYAMISRRIQHEDILTIVDTSFMPHGMECDVYQILGTILYYSKVRNSVTDEAVWQLTVLCNGLTMDIAINAADLLGEPEIGRRFKGVIWLQGKINFE